MSTHNITIRINADDRDNPINLRDVQDAVAAVIAADFGNWNDQHGYEHDNGLVSGFSIDGRPYEPENHRLAEYSDHFTAEVIDHLMNGRKIQAIKTIRENSYNFGVPLSLGEAKALADKWTP